MSGVPTKADIIQAFKEYDATNSGLLTEKQAIAALRDLDNLPFTLDEIKQQVSLGKQTAADANGRIIANDFATYLSFEIMKKGPKQQPQAQNSNNNNQNNNGNDNPFDIFGLFDDSNNNTNANNNNLNQNQAKIGTLRNKPKDMTVNINANNNIKRMNVVVTPVGNNVNGNGTEDQKVDMSASYSPTAAKQDELPDFFGHSLASPVYGDGKTGQQDNGWDIDIFSSDDDNNKKNNNNTSNLGSPTPSTPNINYAPETPQAHKRTNSAGSGGTGLLPAPRQAKESRQKSPKSRTRPSSPNDNNEDDSLFPFANNNDNSNNNEPDSPNSDKKSKRKERKRKQKKNKDRGSADNSDNDDDTGDKDKDKESKDKSKTKDSDKADQPQKKKRHKTDAIAEMKRGTAMLKYGRHGFPHFRRFQLSRDNRRLLWYSRKKSLAETHIEVKDVREVLEGQQTDVFKQCTQQTLKKASFSVVYGSKLKTLDVVAKSQEEAQLWTKGLKGLMKANKVGKLHKVVQILVDVPYADITKPKGKEPKRDPTATQEYSAELMQTIEHTLKESQKTFEMIERLAESKNVQESQEYENTSILVSEIEQRLNEVENGLTQKNVDLIELKRDVWVLKVDVTVLEEKLKVLSKGGAALYL